MAATLQLVRLMDGLPALTALDLAGNPLADAEAAPLVGLRAAGLRLLDLSRTDLTGAGAASEKRRHVGPEAGPASAFCSCVPAGMRGPTGILWADLTAFSR